MSHQNHRSPAVCLLGAAQMTNNLGVSALGAGTITGLRHALPDIRILIQDWSSQPQVPVFVGGQARSFEQISLYAGDKFRSPDSSRHLGSVGRLLSPMPRPLSNLLASYNPTLKQLLSVDAILDISGGDSFADIYGLQGFRRQEQVKQLARQLNKKLILLPQTYGPFADPDCLRRACDILCHASLVATREEKGLDELRNWCGDRLQRPPVFCPDVAFLMEPDSSRAHDEPQIINQKPDRKLIGLNVSGLLYLDQHRDFGLACDYQALTDQLVAWVLSLPDADLLLVPHVLSGSAPADDGTVALASHCESSDTQALLQIKAALPACHAQRVHLLKWGYTAQQTKYFISLCDFFMGARMHACIGAVSQAVPTATLAYSKKAQGVMAMVGVGDTAVDMRSLSTAACVESCSRLFDQRDEIRNRLKANLPGVRSRILTFFEKELAPAIIASSPVAPA